MPGSGIHKSNIHFLTFPIHNILNEAFNTSALDTRVQILGNKISQIPGMIWTVIATYTPRVIVLITCSHLVESVGFSDFVEFQLNISCRNLGDAWDVSTLS